jgi:hypothetical protein
MRNIIVHSIDWLSIKLNVVCMLGFMLGDSSLNNLISLGTVTTIVYNTIKIYQALNSKNKNQD